MVSQTLRDQMVLFMDNRLSSSSQSTIATAVGKHWVPFCQLYDLSLQVASGSPNRGGIMASFIIYLANKQLAYPTITSYLWGVVDHHLALGFASPLSTVRDWSTFMHSVEVETHTPADGRKMLPWRALIQVLMRIDVTSKAEVGMALFLLIMLFTMSRPEIIPKAYTGVNAFNLRKHVARKHVRTIHGYVEVSFRSIKQDPLCKRPAAVYGEAWRAIGGCTGLLNVDRWLSIYDGLMQFSTPHDACNTPFFVDVDDRELIYPRANSLLRMLLVRMGMAAPLALTYAMGGVRSLGYNATKGVDGDETARVQGMWGSNAHMHYDRPMLDRVLSLPSRLAQFAAASTAPISPVGAFEASPGNMVAPAGQAAVPIVRPLAAVASSMALPPGWSTHMTTSANGRSRRFYVHSSGKKLYSMPGVLRFNSSVAAAPPSPASALPTLGAQASPAFRMHPLTLPTFLHEIVVENDRPSKRAKRAR